MIALQDAKIAIIGLGYVGLPLAVEFARAGFQVVGYDVGAARVGELMKGVSYIPDVATEHQVLVITHLPQIAVRADRHLVVSKGVEGGVATSSVAPPAATSSSSSKRSASAR